MIGIFRELIEDKEETIEKEFAKKGNLFSLYYVRSARINPRVGRQMCHRTSFYRWLPFTIPRFTASNLTVE